MTVAIMVMVLFVAIRMPMMLRMTMAPLRTFVSKMNVQIAASRRIVTVLIVYSVVAKHLAPGRPSISRSRHDGMLPRGRHSAYQLV